MCDVRYSQVYTTVNATTRSLRKGTLGIAFLNQVLKMHENLVSLKWQWKLEKGQGIHKRSSI